MLRILLILAASVLFFVYREHTAPDRALDRLTGAPYGVERAEIRPGFGWREYPDGEIGVRVDQGYALAMLEKRYRRTLILRLFTYAAPSLTLSREVLLMGSLEGSVESEAKALSLRDRFRTGFIRRGFAESFSDRVAFGGMDGITRKRVVPLARGELAAHVYYGYDPRRQQWLVRAAVQHPLARRYGDRVAARWPRWWQFERMALPDRLVRELESAGVAGMLPDGAWGRILRIPRTGGSEFRVFDYLQFLRSIDPSAVVPDRRPAILLFRNYLARYLFVYGIPRWAHERRRPEEQIRKLGLDYHFSESGRRGIYGETYLFELVRKYPDTYWGQAAFAETFRLGFQKPVPGAGVVSRSERKRRGEEFLEKWPDSEFTPAVCFHLGKEAEAEYSHSLVRKNRSYHYRNRWRKRPLEPQTDRMRHEAIRWYERALASPERDVFAAHLEYVLPRLRMGIATSPDP